MENAEGEIKVGAGEPRRGGFVPLWTLNGLQVHMLNVRAERAVDLPPLLSVALILRGMLSRRWKTLVSR